MTSARPIITRTIVLGALALGSLLQGGCGGAKEPTEQAKLEAKKEADAQLERAAERARKQQAGQ